MAITTTHHLNCERCGIKQDVETEFNDKASAILEANKVGNYDWQRTKGNRILCGECNRAYEQLIGKHDKELSQFFKAHPDPPFNSRDW